MEEFFGVFLPEKILFHQYLIEKDFQVNMVSNKEFLCQFNCQYEVYIQFDYELDVIIKQS
jgi:hypothetical protein